MPGSTKKDEEEQPQLNFRRCREYGLGKLRDRVLMTIQIYIYIAKYGLGLEEGAGKVSSIK